MNTEETMTTQEAAERLGTNPKTLRRWQWEGYLSPLSEGEGNGRRLRWREKDIREARDLMNQESRKSQNDAIVDALGGGPIISAWKRALDMANDSAPGTIILVGKSGPRQFRRDEPIGTAAKSCGSPAILLICD